MALKSDIAVLQQTPLLSELEPEALRLLAFAAEGRSYTAGAVLFRRGDPSDGGYVITSGAVEIDALNGAPTHVARAGSLIGELALIVATERPATAIAKESTTALRITREMFRRVLQEFPQSATIMRDQLAAEARQTAERLAGVGYRLAAVDLDEQRLLKTRGL